MRTRAPDPQFPARLARRLVAFERAYRQLWAGHVKTASDDQEPAPVSVLVYPDRKVLRSALSRLSAAAPSFEVGGAYLADARVLAVAYESPLERLLISNLVHEDTHLLNREILGVAGLSPWLNEGLAQYAQFSQLTPEGDFLLGTIDKGSEIRRGEGDDAVTYRFLPWRNLSYMMGQFRRRHHLSLDGLLAVGDDRQFYAEQSHLRYAQSWTLVHLLLDGRMRGRGPLRPRFFQYVSLEQRGMGGREALLDVLDVTMEKLDDAWYRHVKKLH
ncbi:MAG: hypothetical protein ACE5HU_01845 [Acidobacteriota bacterium]